MDIVREFERAQKEVQKLVRKRLPLGEIKRRVLQVLRRLYKAVDVWTEEEIPEMYASAKNDVLREIKRAQTGVSTARDSEAIYNAAMNVGIRLEEAIEAAQKNMEAFIDSLIDTPAERQKLREYVEKGVPSQWFLRGGERVFMTLLLLAADAEKNSRHELRNVAAVNVAHELDLDLVFMSYHIAACPLCIPYEGRVYSLSGQNPNYPWLYSTPWSEEYQNFHPNCRHIISPYIEALKTPEELEEIRKYSNRSFVIGGEGWTPEQVRQAQRNLRAYRMRQAQKRRLRETRYQYGRYVARLGDKAPKTFAAFARIKAANGAAWARLQKEYRALLN